MEEKQKKLYQEPEMRIVWFESTMPLLSASGNVDAEDPEEGENV